MNIGSKVKLLRIKNDYTLKQLSELAGLPMPLISDIENGKINPSWENINQLASALGIASNYLTHSDQEQKIIYLQKRIKDIENEITDLKSKTLNAASSTEKQQIINVINTKSKKAEEFKAIIDKIMNII